MAVTLRAGTRASRWPVLPGWSPPSPAPAGALRGHPGLQDRLSFLSARAVGVRDLSVACHRGAQTLRLAGPPLGQRRHGPPRTHVLHPPALPPPPGWVWTNPVAAPSLGGSWAEWGPQRCLAGPWAAGGCGVHGPSGAASPAASPGGRCSGDTRVLLLPGPVWAAGPQPPRPHPVRPAHSAAVLTPSWQLGGRAGSGRSRGPPGCPLSARAVGVRPGRVCTESGLGAVSGARGSRRTEQKALPSRCIPEAHLEEGAPSSRIQPKRPGHVTHIPGPMLGLQRGHLQPAPPGAPCGRGGSGRPGL